jgi:23S rRNA (guanosine2251-2'-O)-methyltransferase
VIPWCAARQLGYKARMHNQSKSARRSRYHAAPARPPAPGEAAPGTATAEPRPSAGSQVIYGIHAVTELLGKRPGQVHALFVLRDGAGDEPKAGSALAALQQTALRASVRPIEKSRGELDRLSRGGVHQGVVALCGEFQYAAGVADLLAYAAAQEAPPLLVIADGITDPQNLGALVRSTYVLGGHGVIIPADRAVGVTPAAIKAAAGATEILPIAQVKNLVRALDELKEAGVWLVAAVAPGQQGELPWRCDLAQPCALVLGSEGRGLRPLVRKTCELRVEIPMTRGLHGASLNVAVAGAALLYEALRQRQQLAPIGVGQPLSREPAETSI